MRLRCKIDLKAACKRVQQLQQCWELLRACWQWCAKGCNNSQQVWDLKCIVGRIQLISLCNPCVMSVRGPNNVGRAVQTDPTSLRYASAIRGTKKMLGIVGWKVWLVSNFVQQHATTSNNLQQCVQTDATCNFQQCWELLASNVASVWTGFTCRRHNKLTLEFSVFRPLQLFPFLILIYAS